MRICSSLFEEEPVCLFVSSRLQTRTRLRPKERRGRGTLRMKTMKTMIKDPANPSDLLPGDTPTTTTIAHPLDSLPHSVASWPSSAPLPLPEPKHLSINFC